MEHTSEEAQEEKRPSLRDEFNSHITTLAASILPFIQSIPPLALWGGLMTVPLITYFAIMLTSPNQFFEALIQLFFEHFLIELVVAIIGFIILIYSIIFMRFNKKECLIKTGPYSLVRHPQYLGVILFITTISCRSYWILTHTFGIGWLQSEGTVVLWLFTLVAYIVLAKIEESHLMNKFGEDYNDYRRSVGFIIPYTSTDNKWIEIFISILIPVVIFIALLTSANLLFTIW